MTEQALLELPKPLRVLWIENVRRDLRKLAEREGLAPEPEFPLSQPSATWAARVESAMVDFDVSQANFDELREALIAYCGGVPEEEAAAIQERLWEFDYIKRRIIEEPDE